MGHFFYDAIYFGHNLHVEACCILRQQGVQPNELCENLGASWVATQKSPQIRTTRKMAPCLWQIDGGGDRVVRGRGALQSHV